MKIIRNVFALCTIVFVRATSPAMASQTGCSEHFANGRSPDFINQMLPSKTREICCSGFVSIIPTSPSCES